jgi:uncharacterized protein (TIGR03000 family)
MYSVLMMAALSTGGDAANCHWFHRGDCCGCYGGCYGSCYGCYGWYNGACTGSCYGCYGCHGFTYNCGGCWGGCSGCWGGCYGCGGCWGGATYAPSYGSSVVYPPAGAVPGGQTMPPAKSDALPEPKVVAPQSYLPTRARLLVEVPADAKLFIDDQLMKTTSEHRAFNTPVLDNGQTYYYELRAEVVRDGKPVSVTKRVTLKAGDVVQTKFGEMEAAETISTVKAR